MKRSTFLGIAGRALAAMGLAPLVWGSIESQVRPNPVIPMPLQYFTSFPAPQDMTVYLKFVEPAPSIGDVVEIRRRI